MTSSAPQRSVAVATTADTVLLSHAVAGGTTRTGKVIANNIRNNKINGCFKCATMDLKASSKVTGTVPAVHPQLFKTRGLQAANLPCLQPSLSLISFVHLAILQGRHERKPDGTCPVLLAIPRCRNSLYLRKKKGGSQVCGPQVCEPPFFLYLCTQKIKHIKQLIR